MSYFGNFSDPTTGDQCYIDDDNSFRANPVYLLAGTSFVGGTKDTNFWAEVSSSSGAVTQVTGTVNLYTGASANGVVQYQSVRSARLVPGAENTMTTMVRMGDTGTANNIRNWGVFTGSDGMFFQLSGTNVNIVTRSNSIDVQVPQANWNVSTAFTLDTNYHRYAIRYNTYDVHFYIDEVLKHTFSPTTASAVSNFNLPIAFQNNNSNGSTTNVNMYTNTAAIFRAGPVNTESKYQFLSGALSQTLKYGAGRLRKVIIGASANGSVTLYDNTAASGLVIAVLNTNAAGNPQPFYLDFDSPFSIGLTAVVVGANFATVIYE
jgi:hypothetical protein